MNEKPAMSKHLIIDINHIILIKLLPKKNKMRERKLARATQRVRRRQVSVRSS